MAIYQLRLDYATFNYDPDFMDKDKVERLLHIEGSGAWQCRHPDSVGARHTSPWGLKYQHDNGWAAYPHRLDVSGVGCEKFISQLPDLFIEGHTHFSRLDFAFDVVISRTAWREFIARAFRESLFSDRSHRRYCLSGDGEAMTIYIGNRRSYRFCRIYNKSLQDKSFVYSDALTGEEITVGDDEYVIRYEMEFKRSNHGSSGIYDPSELFSLYYGDESMQASLSEFLRKSWLTYGDDLLLPDDFDSAEFCMRCTKIKILCNSELGISDDDLRDMTWSLSQAPRSFDNTLIWMTNHLGRYLPWLLADKSLWQVCLSECKRIFGFVPELDFIELSSAVDAVDIDIPDIERSVSDEC